MGKPCAGPDRLAVLPVSHDRLVDDLFGQRNAAGDGRGVSALGEHPGGSGVLSYQTDDELQRHAGPFVGADQPMRVLDRQIPVRLLPVLPAVAGALEKHDAGYRRHGLQVVDREDQVASAPSRAPEAGAWKGPGRARRSDFARSAGRRA